MIILQELLFPNLGTCPDFEMYFRTDSGSKHAYEDPASGCIHVPRWCTLDGDTYFNAFSIGKWVKYTQLQNLRLQLELKGEFRVQLIHWQRLRDKCLKAVVAERLCQSAERETFDLAFPEDLSPRGLYAFSLYAVGKGCSFFGGRYATDVDESALNDVDIALDICTFKREKYIAANLAMLRRDILENPASDLRGHLEVFISDNGRTLDAHTLATEGIHIYPNKNVGGAGGFTRGMIQIIDHSKAFSHVLVMDDDVIVNSDAIVRTYRLLRLLKPQYAGKTIAGALMRLDKRYKQFENGAVMNSYILRGRKMGYNMLRIERILRNEQEETLHYNGWWYSCIPMSKVTNDNLPLPVFVHRDDVEFGLRTGSDILTLNGICLWHESFDHKYASSMEYYEVRNDLILNALRRTDVSSIKIIRELMHRTVGNAIRYRYTNCEFIFRGIDDFLAGPDHLILQDPEALHADILARSDKLLPLEQLEKEIPFKEKKHLKSLKLHKRRINTVRIYLLNGIFLPANRGTNIVNIGTPWPRNYYRRKAVLNYDEVNQKGFISTRDFKKTMGAMGQIVKRAFRLTREYAKTCEAWREAQPILTSRSFWNEYLGLK